MSPSAAGLRALLHLRSRWWRAAVAVAVSLGDRLESLEVNPLLVRGAQVEALDALITWRD